MAMTAERRKELARMDRKEQESLLKQLLVKHNLEEWLRDKEEIDLLTELLRKPSPR